MEELERKLLEAILKQNKLIIKQNKVIIDGLDCIGNGLYYRHTPSYQSELYRSIILESEEALNEIDNIEQELKLTK